MARHSSKGNLARPIPFHPMPSTTYLSPPHFSSYRIIIARYFTNYNSSWMEILRARVATSLPCCQGFCHFVHIFHINDCRVEERIKDHQYLRMPHAQNQIRKPKNRKGAHDQQPRVEIAVAALLNRDVAHPCNRGRQLIALMPPCIIEDFNDD